MPQQLSSKDAALFRQVVRHYENKQYKKGRLCYIIFILSRGHGGGVTHMALFDVWMEVTRSHAAAAEK